MKKKIFIAGAVRDYDSDQPDVLAEEIKKHICDHIVDPNSAPNVNVIVDEPQDKTVRIRYPFTTGERIDKGTISQELYRCFTGEYKDFVAQNSCWFTMGFGPSFQMVVKLDVDDIADAFKKNTNFYGASRFKSFDITEYYWGLEVLIGY